MIRKISKLARRPMARFFGGGGFDNHNGLYPNRLGIYAGAVYTDDIVPGSEQGYGVDMHEIERKGGFEGYIEPGAVASYQENVHQMSQYLSNISLSPALEKAEFYRKIAEVKDTDHTEVVRVKKLIQKLVDDELAYLGYLNEVSEEESKAVVEKTMGEVARKSNFYFNIEPNRAQENVHQFDKKAPGNKFKFVSRILPHDTLDPQNYLDVANLTPEIEDEILTYFTFLVDLHIGQIRPSHILEKSYNDPDRHPQYTLADAPVFKTLDNHYFEYYYRFRHNPKPLNLETQDINFQKAKDAMPRAEHPEGKWAPTDVEWTPQQKFPHVASRLGYPIMAFDEWEKIFGFERPQSHPGYQIQPFVQTPSMDPDEDVNFELGETLYENTQITEWIKFWKASWATVLFFGPCFYIYEIWCSSGFPSMQWANQHLLMSGNAPRQFQDTVDLDLYEMRYPDNDDYMNVQYSYKRGYGRPSNAMYMGVALAFWPFAHFDYASKVVYNRDKDLVYVYKLKGYFNESEEVYEVAHLEQMVPFPTTSWKDLSQMHENGIIKVRCMSTNKQFRLYGDDKYWNLDEKKGFLRNTRNLWRNVVDGQRGQHFFTAGAMPSRAAQEQLERAHNQVMAAVEKHGEVRLHKDYKDWFAEKLAEERKNKALPALKQ